MDYKDAISKLEKSGVLVKDGEAVDVSATLEKGRELAGDNHNISFEIRIKNPLGGPIQDGLLEMVASQLHDVMGVSILNTSMEEPDLLDDLERQEALGVETTRASFSVDKDKQLPNGMVDFSKGDGQPLFTVNLGIINTVGLDEDILKRISDYTKSSMEENVPLFGVEKTQLHVSRADKDFRHALEVVYDSAREMPLKNDISNRRKMH